MNKLGECSALYVQLACITFPTKNYQIFTTTSCYGRHLSIVWHNSKFATVQNRVTVGGCSMVFEYNFLCQFSRAVARRMLFTRS